VAIAARCAGDYSILELRSLPLSSMPVTRGTNPHPVCFRAIATWSLLLLLSVAQVCSAQTASSASGDAAGSKQQTAPQSTAKPELNKPVQQSGSEELFDEPKFTVAGVADASSAGGHGSSAAVRNREGLAKAAVSLGPDAAVQTADATSEKALREAVVRQSMSFEANHQLGEMLLNQGNASEALTYLQRASKINSADYDNRCDIARAQAAAGEFEIARRTARSLLLERDSAEPHHLLGEANEKLGNPLDAVREYQRAAELTPSETNLFDWGAELLLHRANEPAIEVFAKGNRLYPKSARHLIGLAVALHARGSYEQAQQRLCEAADLRPEDPNPYLFMGQLLSAQSLASDSVSERLARFVKLRPDDAKANYFYALSLLNQPGAEKDQKKILLAESLLEKAIRLDPKLAGAYLRIGAIASDRGDFVKAIRLDSKAVAVDEQSPEAHYALAQAYSRGGEKGKAEEELRLYQRVSKETTQKLARERNNIQEFVVALPNQNTAAQPK